MVRVDVVCGNDGTIGCETAVLLVQFYSSVTLHQSGKWKLS